jgi:hypothetical protein
MTPQATTGGCDCINQSRKEFFLKEESGIRHIQLMLYDATLATEANVIGTSE